jgi:hypothetical protein
VSVSRKKLLPMKSKNDWGLFVMGYGSQNSNQQNGGILCAVQTSPLTICTTPLSQGKMHKIGLSSSGESAPACAITCRVAVRRLRCNRLLRGPAAIVCEWAVLSWSSGECAHAYSLLFVNPCCPLADGPRQAAHYCPPVERARAFGLLFIYIRSCVAEHLRW